MSQNNKDLAKRTDNADSLFPIWMPIAAGVIGAVLGETLVDGIVITAGIIILMAIVMAISN